MLIMTLSYTQKTGDTSLIKTYVSVGRYYMIRRWHACISHISLVEPIEPMDTIPYSRLSDSG